MPSKYRIEYLTLCSKGNIMCFHSSDAQAAILSFRVRQLLTLADVFPQSNILAKNVNRSKLSNFCSIENGTNEFFI